jgi:hypothetical protein
LNDDDPTDGGISKKRNACNIRDAIVGLGHLAQVAVLPAFTRTHIAEIAALVTMARNRKEGNMNHAVVRKTGCGVWNASPEV